MNKVVLTICLAFLLVPTLAFADDGKTKRYAVVVANNGSVDEGVAPLRFADDDGARFYELFSSMVDQAHLLTTLDDDSQRVFPNLVSSTQPPTHENLKARVNAVARSIAKDREAGIDTEVYLVFTGHGNVDDGGEGYLSLADGKLRRSDLQRDVIAPLNADYTHLIIDACHAYFMVRSRGGDEDWQDDRSGETLDDAFNAFLTDRSAEATASPTVGVILSTSGTAEVHEWSKFRGGVFSHQLRSGLLGAADADGDGSVTYVELEAYLVAANAAVTNPRARINVFAEPPAQDKSRALTKIDRYRDAARLIIPAGVGGRYHVEDSRGLRYADMHVDPAAATTLALLRRPTPGGKYYLRTDKAQASIDPSDDEVRSPQLAFAQRDEQSRGSVEESFRKSLFATPFGPAFVQGYQAGRRTVRETRTAPAPVVAPQSSWTSELALDYAAGTAPLRVGGVQHHLSASLTWLHDSGIGLGPFLGYGFSDTDLGAFHRLSGGLQVEQFTTVEAWRFGPRLRLGHQGVFFVGEEGLTADPLGLRGEAALVLTRDFSEGVDILVHAGASVDVVTQTDGTSSNEQVLLNPFAGVGVRF